MEPHFPTVLLYQLPQTGQEAELIRVIILSGIILLLLSLAAIYSGSETAYFSLDADHKTRLESMQGKRAFRTLKLLSSPEPLLATIMISKTIVYVLIIILSSVFLSSFHEFDPFNLKGLFLQLLVISPVILLFGKIIPNVLSHNHPVRFALFTSGILTITSRFISPLAYLLVRSSSALNRRIIRNSGNLSINELTEALDHDKNVITEDRKILKGIANFGNIEVSDIMKPRMDVFSVDSDTDFSVLVSMINESGYSRIPVFAEHFDNIRGILYVKDLLPYLDESADYKWQKLIRPGYFVPGTKKIKDLLQEFLDKKIHMAVVVDEYGGTEGIVTLEDVLEEIVGEITDETDEIESYYSRIDDYNFIFDAKILLNDFFKTVQISEEMFTPFRGEADTLAGLILEIKGEFPQVNDTILMKNFTFTILSVDERRIKKVKFTLDKNIKNR